MYFVIGKQKIVWILKCKEQHKEAAGNALSRKWGTRRPLGPTLTSLVIPHLAAREIDDPFFLFLFFK